jgi:hypothetical protein
MNKISRSFYIIFLVLVFHSTSQAQNFGIVLGYSSKDAFIAGGHFINNNFLYRFSVSFEPSAAKGQEVSEQKENYGRTVEGTGDYFTTYDLSVGYYVTPKLTLSSEFSIGRKKYYTSYIDNRFTDGGYHMIDKSESLFGLGLNAGYRFYSGIGILIGYNTVRELSFAITYDF